MLRDDCYIQDRFWTDPDENVDKKEIAKRQAISGKLPGEVQNIEKSLNTIIEQFEEMKKDLFFLLSENEDQQN